MTEPRKVMFVIGALVAGGQERQLLTIIKKLDRSRWSPVVVAFREGNLADEFRKFATVVHTGKRWKYDPLLPLRVWRIIARRRPAVLHTFMFTANTFGRLGALLCGKERPVVVAAEGGIDDWKKGLHRRIDRFLLRATDVIVPNSEAIARFLVEGSGIPAQFIVTIPNGIDLERSQRHIGMSRAERDAHRAALGFGPDDFVVGHIGRPTADKRLDVLLDVVERLRPRIPSLRVLRVSPPPLDIEREYAEWFEREIDARGVRDSVSAHPFTTDISFVLALMDAVVQTSDHEGLSNVVLEAMTMEVPVVATAAGGTARVVRHRETGWLVPVDDRDGLADGLAYVHAHRDEISAWNTAARHLVETEYSAAILASRHENLYERLLAARERKR